MTSSFCKDECFFSSCLFQKMKKQARYFSTEIKQIDLDVNRTFRNHIMFMDRFGVKSVSPQEVLPRGRPCSICISFTCHSGPAVERVT